MTQYLGDERFDILNKSQLMAQRKTFEITSRARKRIPTVTDETESIPTRYKPGTLIVL